MGQGDEDLLLPELLSLAVQIVSPSICIRVLPRQRRKGIIHKVRLGACSPGEVNLSGLDNLWLRWTFLHEGRV